MKAKVMLFHSPFCPHCPPAKKLIEKIARNREDIVLLMFNTNTPEGVRKATEMDIVSTPTFIITGPGHDENIGLRGIQNESVLNKYIDIALGKRKIEERKSFLDRWRSIIKK